jgi:hypothetical protein
MQQMNPVVWRRTARPPKNVAAMESAADGRAWVVDGGGRGIGRQGRIAGEVTGVEPYVGRGNVGMSIQGRYRLHVRSLPPCAVGPEDARTIRPAPLAMPR